MGNIVINWIFSNAVKACANMVDGVLELIADILNNIFAVMVELNNTSEVNSALAFTSSLAIVLITVSTVKTYMTTYILQTDGSAEEDPLNIIVRACQGGVIISISGWIFDELLKISELVTSDLISSVGQTSITSHLSGLIGAALQSLTNSTGVLIILILVIVIGMIVFSVVAAIRGAELMLFKILTPIFACDIVGSKERWNSFLTSYIITMFSYGLQMFSFRLFCRYVLSLTVAGGGSLVVCLGWLYVMIFVPKWLEKFSYSTGLKQKTGNTVRTAASIAIMKG